MANFAGLWAGNIYGTNTGKVFLELRAEDGRLTGVARLNDDSLGVVVYNVSGTQGEEVALECVPTQVPEDVEAEPVRVTGRLVPDGSVTGRWETDSGTGGTFRLFPHTIGTDQQSTKAGEPEQIYNRVLQLGSIRIYKDDVARIVEMVRKDFTVKNLIATYEQHGNEITKWADDFLKEIDQITALRSLKLFIQEPGRGSVNRLVNIELLEVGDSTVRVSGPDETWVVGKAESVRKALGGYENSVVTNYRKHGLNMNFILFLIMLILMPSILGILRRVIFVLVVMILIRILFAIHSRVIPNTLILIKAKPKGAISLAWPSMLSWLLAFTSSLVAALMFWLLTRQS
jgi:hypothetical protein